MALPSVTQERQPNTPYTLQVGLAFPAKIQVLMLSHSILNRSAWEITSVHHQAEGVSLHSPVPFS